MRGFPRLITSKKDSAGMITVPMQMRPVQGNAYPSDNTHPFERWYMESFSNADARDRIYLPIQWTALYCNGNFGKNRGVIATIQAFLNSLDKSKKYYTIVQYDDGILNDLSHLDIKVFGMSGGRVDYPIPLLCMPHKGHTIAEEIYSASFIGNITHSIRKKMIEQLVDHPLYFISSDRYHMDAYCKVITQSCFVLAPRGYGPTSFRICEAIQFGKIPVYISDVHVLPYNLPFDYGILLGSDDKIGDAIEASDILKLSAKVLEVQHLFTYAGCKQMILAELNTQKDG